MKMTIYGNPVIHRYEVATAIERVLEHVEYPKYEILPRLNYCESEESSLTVSFFLLAEDQPNLGAFFYEMITRSLLPGRHLEVALFFCSSVERNLIAAELVVQFKTEKQREEAKRHFEILEEQIRVGLRSPYHAARILELKGMSVDEKRIRVQERIAQMVNRFPQTFDYDFFSLVQHYFVSVKQEFFRFHEVRQIAENLSGFYLFKKHLIAQIEMSPERRHLFVKVRKRRLHDPFGMREVLGVSIGLNFLGERELFSQKHLHGAILHLLPHATILEESEYLYEDSEYPLHILYVEIDVSEKEVSKKLAQELPFVLKGRVERLQRPLFMPHNEEEVMRHVITLGGQLKYARDIPQVILSFTQQTDTKLYFKVILARILFPHSALAESLVNQLKKLEPQIERIKKIGRLRKKYFKEALVFKIELSLADFLREDQSVDLYLARRFILSQIETVFGEVRDYNGGMISKQNETLTTLHQLLGDLADKNQLLLENFFHALFPVEKRSLTDPLELYQLFDLLLNHLEGEEVLSYRKQKEVGYILIEVLSGSTREKFLNLPKQLEFSSQPISLQLVHDERRFLGFILHEKIAEFYEKIRFLNGSFL